MHKLGYLFDFEGFLKFLTGVAKNILEVPLTKALEMIELSEGLITLRRKVGKALTFMSLLDNYEQLEKTKEYQDK